MARAAKAKKEVEVSLETVLWNCRVALRGVGTTEKNRDAVIGLVFLKFAGDKFEKRRKELQEQYGDIPAFLEKPSFYNAANVFYLKETARWSYIVKNASANNIAVIIDQAMADIEESNPPLKGALTLNLFPTLGADKSKIKDLIDNVNQIDEKRFQEEDLIGRVYEYFLQIYAASGTKEDGEFYTPACVVKLIAEMIEPYSGVVYDPCCGSGGMFVQSAKFIENHGGNINKISVFGQDSNPTTWKMAQMNLAIRGIEADLGKFNADTFFNDCHPQLKADFIMANPPFNLSGWGADKLVASAASEGESLGLTADELAFYDALTKPQAVKDFYEHDELIAITKELADLLRKNRTIDWQKKESARAGMRRLVKRLLKKYKYPPEGMNDAVQTVMSQCEMWADNVMIA